MSCKSALRDAATPIRALVSGFIEEIDYRLNAENYIDADTADSGWFEEHSDVVVSRILFGGILHLTSQTAFSASRNAMQLSTASFARSECNVLYVSRTLKAAELACNLMAQAAGLNVEKLASGRLSDSEWDKLEIALEQMVGQQFSAIHAQQIDIPLLWGWLKYVSSKFDSTPLVVLDDALLLPGIKRRSKDGGQSELLELSRIASSVDALIVLVQHTPMH